jgi:hypothetical protein
LLGVRAFLAITAHVGFLLRIFHAIKVTPLVRTILFHGCQSAHLPF